MFLYPLYACNKVLAYNVDKTVGDAMLGRNQWVDMTEESTHTMIDR